MDDILIFIGVMLAILAVLFIIIMSKVGFSYTALKDYIKKIENKSVLQAVTGIISATAVVAFFVFMIGQVVAEESKWFDTGSIFVGIDYHQNGSVFCVGDGKLNSNMGAAIEVYQYGDHSMSGVYTHHSCAINSDVNTYDAIGFKYEWKIF